MSSDGKFIYCGMGTPDWQGPQEVQRVLCLTRSRGEICETCPGSSFTLRIQVGIGRQSVACPRWKDDEDRRRRREPRDYVLRHRETCLNDKPFAYCPSCPNSDPSLPPQGKPGWWEEELRREVDIEEETE